MEKTTLETTPTTDIVAEDNRSALLALMGVCPSCEGSGKSPFTSCDPSYPKRRACIACNGTGEQTE